MNFRSLFSDPFVRQFVGHILVIEAVIIAYLLWTCLRKIYGPEFIPEPRWYFVAKRRVRRWWMLHKDDVFGIGILVVVLTVWYFSTIATTAQP